MTNLSNLDQNLEKKINSGTNGLRETRVKLPSAPPWKPIITLSSAKEKQLSNLQF